MLGKERQNEIINYLKQHDAVSVKKLTELLYASEATVRRDLCELEKMGLVVRVFGGATLAGSKNTQIPLFVREGEMAEEKNEICRRAAALISDGDVIFLDASSTAQAMVKHLAGFHGITVITNGLKVADLLLENHVKTFCTGGAAIDNSYALIGRHAESFLREIRADVCFLSCKGMSEEGVFTDTSEQETDLRRVALSVSKKRVMLLTDSKIGKTYMHRLCDTREIDHLITNRQIPPSLRFREEKNG